MVKREFNLSELKTRGYCGTYQSRKELIDVVISENDDILETDLTYGLQYIQPVNRQGRASNWYNSELSRNIQLSFVTNPDGSCTLHPMALVVADEVSQLPLD